MSTNRSDFFSDADHHIARVKNGNWWQFMKKEAQIEELKRPAAVSIGNIKEKRETGKVTMESSEVSNVMVAKNNSGSGDITAQNAVKEGVSLLVFSVDPMAVVAGPSFTEKGEDDTQKAASTCPHCRQLFPNHFQMVEHVKICHVLPVEHSYKTNCNLNCGAAPSPHKFNIYERELYVKQCFHEICGTNFKMNEDLKQLKCIHRSETPNSCDVCSAALRLSMNFQKEKVTPDGDKPYVCDKYEKNYIFLNDLSEQNEQPYKCNVCNATFKQWIGLRNHTHVQNQDKPYVCNMCGTGFKQLSALETHKRTHTNQKPYLCDICDAAFKQSSHLKQHKRIHTKETPYSCDICPAAFKQSVHLKQHKRIHTNEKPYVCDVCNAAFRQSEHLRQHKRVHTNETPYACDMCSSAFKQSVHLKQHKRIHTNEKPYGCDICSAAFKQSEHLKLHKRTHTNEKPYACDICNSAFKQSAHLKQHRRTHFPFKV